MIPITRNPSREEKFTKEDLEDMLWLAASILVPVTVLILAYLDKSAAF